MSPAPARSSSRRLWALTAGLVAVFTVGLVLVGSVIVVRGRILDADAYTSALVATDAYERTYTEVLADPELARLQEQLLGELRLGPASSLQARALATNVLRLAVPPSTLRAGTERVVTDVLAYIRGDTDRVDSRIAIDGVLARIDDVAAVRVRTQLAGAVDRQIRSIDGYRDAVIEFADALAAGTVPDGVPVVGGTDFDPVEVTDAILAALGPRVDDETRRAVTAAVTAEDERNALITAAAVAVEEHATEVSARLASEAHDGQVLDVVEALADQARRPVDQVVGSLNTVRDAAAWLGPLSGVLGALAALGAAAALAWIHRDDWRRAAAVGAVALVVAGVATFAMWWLVGRAVGAPLGDGTATGAGSWNLPPALRALLGDIQGELAAGIAGTVRRQAGVLVATGAVLGAGAILGPRLRRLGATRVLAGAAAVAAVVAVTGVVFAAGRASADAARACNGSPELCDRSYADVVYAATHNSMSSPDVVAVWPEHDGDLRAQLDAGVRALLIDTHYWAPVTSAQDLLEAVGDDELPLPPAVADAVFDGLGTLGAGRPGTFLCHNHCAFGGEPFLDGMTSVREFLDDNPDEVVTLIIQDAITPDETADVMGAAGLDDVLYDHSADETWPTLGELIERGRRLVVFAEQEGPPPDWYANAFEAMQETPFLFLSPEQFSCAPNRGTTDAPLFLMNHWVQRIAPDRVDSVNVNRLDVLVDRARQCERERGRLPNYLAVNFYNIGDVMAAADVLNGVD